MNTIESAGAWKVLKAKLKQRYAILTEQDLLFVEGAEDKLFGRLEMKLGKTRQEILHSIEKVNQITF